MLKMFCYEKVLTRRDGDSREVGEPNVHIKAYSRLIIPIKHAATNQIFSSNRHYVLFFIDNVDRTPSPYSRYKDK